ncbi:hypothetical protein [Mycobacterium sp. ACS1612]|uniref:hypothetical protein n=1 Tax=Mycobacterium sp. ACS1612 TaxID=1834117 RepID=UPI0012EA19EE|nr:hypothetical protein [Mycobacterium sp. ACS1612]
MAASGSHVRVALVGCSGLLGDIIGQTVAAQPDLDVVAELASPGREGTLPEVDADIVVWNNADEEIIAQWLAGPSRRVPRVLATLVDGQQAALWELTPHRTELGALSPDTLIQTIHDTGAAPS